MMSRYEKIKELCKDRGINVSKLERDLGFSRGSLCKIDKNKPSIDRLGKIASYFDVPVEYFSDVQNSGQKLEYYDPEILEMTQAINENPDLRVLMQTAMKMNKESLPALSNLLYELKGTNPDG